MKLIQLVILVPTLIGLLCCNQSLLAQNKQLRIGSGSQQGVYYPFAKSIEMLLNERLKVDATGLSTKGSSWNAEKLGSKDLEAAMIQNDVAFYAFEHIENQVENKNLRAIASLYSEDIHIVVSNASGIKQLEDMVGKHIAVGNTGSGQYRNAKQILETANIFTQILADYSPIDVAVQKMKRGEIDGIFYTAGWPNKAISEITANMDVRFIPIPKALSDQLIAEYPFYVASFLPTKAYPVVDRVVPTVAVRAMLTVREDLPDSLVYAMTRLIFENISFLKRHHPKWSAVQIPQARIGVGIPFHPGAETYLLERTLAVKHQPYSISDIAGYTLRGARVNILKEKWNMCQITLTDGSLGWLPKDALSQITRTRIDGYKVQVDALNFRTGPSRDSYIQGLLHHGDVLEKIRELDNTQENLLWFQVRRKNGERGWVAARHLTPFSFEGHAGLVKTVNQSALQDNARDRWVKTTWEGMGSGESLSDRFNRLQPFLSKVDLSNIKDKLDLFELRGRHPETSGQPLQHRIRDLETKLDSATYISIDNILTEVEQEI